MRDRKNLEQLIGLGPDYIGFIFYSKSSRFVGEEFNPDITAMVPASIRKVGVFVDADAYYVSSRIVKYGLDFVQLHGTETPDYCRKFYGEGTGVIKSFSIDEDFDFNILEDYADNCSYFLFDTKTPLFGGSGEKFNWGLLEKYQLPKPFFLSGGLGIDDAEKITRIKNLNIHALDINSRFELQPGIKNIDMIKEFITKIKHN
ncbi:MAG: phosphoribosylanthranilate isomerase [Bacteroidales bacterium]|nr:phosphoribosylanthranilate isomerase [Bacteroidales bacterium]